MIILPCFEFFLSHSYVSYVFVVGLLAAGVWKVIRG